LPLLLNKTNAKTIAQLYGNNPAAWVGQLITLFPSTTSVGGQECDCVRVRPKVPSAKRTKEEPVQQREPGDDAEETDAAAN
jgi:hypothetical protein